MRLFRAGWIVPVDGPPVRDGGLAVEDGRVALLGPFDAVAARHPAAEVRELGPGVLMPGLVNAHCHLELSHLKGRIAGGDFTSWVGQLVDERARDATDPRPATAAAIEAVVQSGTVAIGDVSNRLDHIQELAASPLRAVVFHELLAWNPSAAERALGQARIRLSAVGGARPAPNVQIKAAAHAPHSVSPALFKVLVDEGGPAALHLSESPDETRFLQSGDGGWKAFLEQRGLGDVWFEPPRRSPVRYMEMLGVLRPGLLAAHCVQADVNDLRTLAAHGVAVVVCPRSNRNLGVGQVPLREMISVGLRVALGTDSLASVESLDLVDDLALLAREFPEVDAGRLLRIATADGAKALGFPDLGSLARGRVAALAFAEGPAALGDPLAFLLSGDARPRPVPA
jgi:aminodeoxyfutalosine deaminase